MTLTNTLCAILAGIAIWGNIHEWSQAWPSQTHFKEEPPSRALATPTTQETDSPAWHDLLEILHRNLTVRREERPRDGWSLTISNTRFRAGNDDHSRTVEAYVDVGDARWRSRICLTKSHDDRLRKLSEEALKAMLTAGEERFAPHEYPILAKIIHPLLLPYDPRFVAMRDHSDLQHTALRRWAEEAPWDAMTFLKEDPNRASLSRYVLPGLAKRDWKQALVHLKDRTAPIEEWEVVAHALRDHASRLRFLRQALIHFSATDARDTLFAAVARNVALRDGFAAGRALWEDLQIDAVTGNAYVVALVTQDPLRDTESKRHWLAKVSAPDRVDAHLRSFDHLY